jgi:hypothetical protein
VEKISCISEFTIEFDTHSKGAFQAQAWFDEWTRFLRFYYNQDHMRSLAISRFWFSFCNGRRGNLIKSDWKWDCIVVPSLAVNWYHRSWRQLLSSSSVPVVAESKILEMVIRAVNQGNVYCEVTNVIPFDQSACDASVIFDMIKRNMYPILKGQRHGKRKHCGT